MKTFLVLMLVSANAFALKPGKRVTCESLRAQAEAECEAGLCEEANEEGLECVHDGEFREVIYECSEEAFPLLLKAHNSTLPKNKKLVCEE
jgi:hypothetical protein